MVRKRFAILGWYYIFWDWDRVVWDATYAMEFIAYVYTRQSFNVQFLARCAMAVMTQGREK